MLQKFFGLACLGVAVWSASQALSLRRDDVLADGIVVGVRHQAEVGSDGFSLTHAPIIEFVPKGSAKPVQFQSDLWTAWSSYEKGDSVRVRYLAQTPERARVDSLLGDFLIPVVLTLLGLLGLFGRLSRHSNSTWFSKRWED